MRFFAALALLACAGAQAQDMIELRYRDSESDGTSYQTRILVTKRYLRMDEGRDDGDFALFDRQAGTLVNVMHERGLLMVMPGGRLPEAPPRGYRLEKRLAPVRGTSVRVQLLADGKLCSETVAAAKLFPDAARALAEYKAALAYAQWLTYLSTPAELRQDCDLVQHVWQAGLALAHGLPIEERDYAGHVRQYLGGEKRRPGPALFRLPENYGRVELAGSAEAGAGSSSQPSSPQSR